jgi:FKBP-type peptidyl-prolyl cis-trans isomerase FkpA
VRDIIESMGRCRLTRSTVLVAAVVGAIGAAMGACVDVPASPTVTAPYNQTDLSLGTGADALTGSTLTVDYTGWLYDVSKPERKGLQFDSSIGRTPFVFTLGSGQVIRGWEQGIPGMRAGGTRRLVIPPSLAYGDTRSGPIPQNATLVFEITLISIQ